MNRRRGPATPARMGVPAARVPPKRMRAEAVRRTLPCAPTLGARPAPAGTEDARCRRPYQAGGREPRQSLHDVRAPSGARPRHRRAARAVAGGPAATGGRRLLTPPPPKPAQSPRAPRGARSVYTSEEHRRGKPVLRRLRRTIVHAPGDEGVARVPDGTRAGRVGTLPPPGWESVFCVRNLLSA